MQVWCVVREIVRDHTIFLSQRTTGIKGLRWFLVVDSSSNTSPELWHYMQNFELKCCCQGIWEARAGSTPGCYKPTSSQVGSFEVAAFQLVRTWVALVQLFVLNNEAHNAADQARRFL